MRLGPFILFLALLSVPHTSVAAPEADKKQPSIDILYINANAGEAAGGHTALRLGNTIYHYQFFPNGTFMLVRDHWSSFYFLYNELHNRTIFIASIAVTPTSLTKIKNHFTELLIEQQRFFNTLRALKTQLTISTAMATGEGRVAISHLGFFRQAEELGTINTTDLHKILAPKLAPNTPKQQLETELSLLEIISWQEALTIFHGEFSLEPDTIIPPIPGEPILSPEEIRLLIRFQQKQQQSILTLITSSRPDKGTALLLQMARYLVVQQSIENKQLYTLDPFPDTARTVQIKAEEMQSLNQVQSNLLRQSQQRATLFFQEKSHPEIAYSLLELSRARVAELRRARTNQQEMRVLPKLSLPSRSKTISLAPYSINSTYSQTDIDAQKSKLYALKQEISQRYDYNLLYKNCATELIRALNTSFATSKEGKATLGGWLDPDKGLVFIPFLLYDKSLATFPVQEEQILTSRRLRHLQQLYANENDMLVWLRESNTLSSTLYKPRQKDTPFLFFTDNTLLLRPLQGILNLSYASLHGVAGILTLPFDRGKKLHQAGLGMFYSLPELVFFNIRKGSYATGEHQ